MFFVFRSRRLSSGLALLSESNSFRRAYCLELPRWSSHRAAAWVVLKEPIAGDEQYEKSTRPRKVRWPALTARTRCRTWTIL